MEVDIHRHTQIDLNKEAFTYIDVDASPRRNLFSPVFFPSVFHFGRVLSSSPKTRIGGIRAWRRVRERRDGDGEVSRHASAEQRRGTRRETLLPTLRFGEAKSDREEKIGPSPCGAPRVSAHERWQEKDSSLPTCC